MWKWVGPIVMLIIFISSFIRAVVIPPVYERFFLDDDLNKVSFSWGWLILGEGVFMLVYNPVACCYTYFKNEMYLLY